MTEISFRKKGDETSRKANFDMPESLEALVAKFGEDAVYSNAVDSITISLQALGRRHIDKPDAEIQALFDAWVPGTRGAVVRKSPFEKAQALVGGLNAEQRAALLAQLSSLQGNG